MKALQIEAWALRIVDQVRAGQRIEDTKVELKATWPEPAKAARRIAGQANAARGEPVLWLIGLDEVRGVVGAPPEELASWYPQVQAQFNGLAPRLIDLNVPANDLVLTALLFETDRAPFVVKNPNFGQPGGGPVEYEVPWREGTRVRSARREDLIRLLAPLQSMPAFDILDAVLIARQWREEPMVTWQLNIALFAYLSDDRTVVVPFHKCHVEFEFPGFISWTTLADIGIPTPTMLDEKGLIMNSPTIQSTGSELVIAGSGRAILSARVDQPLVENITSDANITLSLEPVNAERPITLQCSLTRVVPLSDPRVQQWKLVDTDP
jgi:hypothetical protein